MWVPTDRGPGLDVIPGAYYRGLNNYLYYFGGRFLSKLQYNEPQNPILITKAHIVHVARSG